jgi:hypothetical protein
MELTDKKGEQVRKILKDLWETVMLIAEMQQIGKDYK